MKMEFNVPSDRMAEFAEILADEELPNTITGSEDDDTTIMVEYTEDQKEAIYKLLEVSERIEKDEELEGEEEED